MCVELQNELKSALQMTITSSANDPDRSTVKSANPSQSMIGPISIL